VIDDASLLVTICFVCAIAVMANGGLLAESGAHNIAMAAKHHSVPVVVVAGLYKLSPLYAFDQGPPS
jgi:translation initiation factor eIF-2B subunit beta